MLIVFHETLGLDTFAFQDVLPAPKSVEVKVSRDDAILKANRVAPPVENTSFYGQARFPGFVIKTLKEASLRVSTPHWLLDPDRAIWTDNKPPKEVRLCWVFSFTTVNSKPEPDKDHSLVPPDIRVYIDAATGEVVRANFS